MPNRIIRDSCKTSPTLDQLSDAGERMFWRLVTVADDFGRFEADPRILLATCFPLRVGILKISQVSKWYAELEACCLVTTYVVNGKHYGFFNTWERYQRTRARESKYPAPSDDNICGHVQSNVPESKTKTRNEEYIRGPKTAEEGEKIPPKRYQLVSRSSGKPTRRSRRSRQH